MSGKVYLIGAGPGDPELMTLKAARALGVADVVLVDDLVNRGCLRTRAPTRASSRSASAAAAGPRRRRSSSKLMVQLAQEGKTVARLKGGDPFVFGRGGEEMRRSRQRASRSRSFPASPPASACRAALGIPLTHRELAHGVTFVTGHERRRGAGLAGAGALAAPRW